MSVILKIKIECFEYDYKPQCGHNADEVYQTIQIEYSYREHIGIPV